jgi:hypothetical protein
MRFFTVNLLDGLMRCAYCALRLCANYAGMARDPDISIANAKL